MKKFLSIIVTMLIVVSTSSCIKKPGPEVGKWHGSVNINELDLSNEDRTLLSLIAGNVAYEVDVEFCEDDTYSYVMNMDKFREEIQKSASTITGLLIGGNIDIFVERIMNLILDSSGATGRSSYGTYSVNEDDLITAVGSDTQYFKVESGTLYQLNEDGEVIISFSKVE